MAEIKFEVIAHIGVLSESSKGWRKEINFISWNGNVPKYDIREWAPNREKMGKGITLSGEEVQSLKKWLESI
ncbi:YdbC family protein [Lysinibacillus fusiformis]|uniref:YdbC family protein n=1 Tax=Lysinibacillus fusiformis TaxID=28031 RepID=UPI00201BBF8C|nr:PC4/YdbC family ssDNA-binding protein [Lysinibacillus fusiformis]